MPTGTELASDERAENKGGESVDEFRNRPEPGSCPRPTPKLRLTHSNESDRLILWLNGYK